MSNQSPDLPIDAEQIAEMADRGEDISRFFAGKAFMREPLTDQVTVDVTPTLLRELDRAASELKLSRKAVIKFLLTQALCQRYPALDQRTL